MSKKNCANWSTFAQLSHLLSAAIFWVTVSRTRFVVEVQRGNLWQFWRFSLVCAIWNNCRQMCKILPCSHCSTFREQHKNHFLNWKSFLWLKITKIGDKMQLKMDRIWNQNRHKTSFRELFSLIWPKNLSNFAFFSSNLQVNLKEKSI